MTLEQTASSAAEFVAVALDVGGTGIKCALVDTAGTVRHAERHATGGEQGPEAVVATILDVATELADHARADGLRPVAAGVVVPGVVDEVSGVAEWSANLRFRTVPLRGLLSARLGLPTALGHDVRAGALAEARLGGGRTARRMLFVAIGTGIAGGYVVDGRIDAGAHGASGEIGHIVVRSGPGAPACGCGARGCLEALASATSIARAYAARQGRAPYPTKDGGRAPLTAKQVAERAVAGEADAVGVWGEAVAALADGLLTAIALYDPEVIVLGGGLAGAGAVLFDPLREALHTRRTFHRLPRLVPAELGDQAGCLGAALLALDLARADPAGSGPTDPTGSGTADTGPADTNHAESGPTGTGPARTGLAGSGPASSGLTGSGPTGSGPTGSGPTGSGPTGSGPTGSGPTGSGQARTSMTHAGGSGEER
jgi:glucokinase